MNHKPTKGDLIHIPANCCMVDPDNIKSPKRYFIPNSPCMGVLLDNIDEQMTKVYVKGEYWAVETEDIYPYKERRSDG